LKLVDLTMAFEPLESEALYSELATEYKFLANRRPKMRLLITAEDNDYLLPDDFPEKLANLLPALNYQLCTNHNRTTFAQHLQEEQNDLPHVLEHIIIAIFMMIRNDYYQGITLGTKDLAEIIVTYRNKDVAKKVAYLALELLNAVINDRNLDVLEKVKDITGGRVLVWKKPQKVVSNSSRL
jgi:hypothetical protein